MKLVSKILLSLKYLAGGIDNMTAFYIYVIEIGLVTDVSEIPEERLDDVVYALKKMGKDGQEMLDKIGYRE